MRHQSWPTTEPEHWLALLAALTLVIPSAGCVGLNYPGEGPGTAAGESTATGAPGSPSQPPSPEDAVRTWSSHTRDARASLQMSQLAAAEESYMAALAATASLDSEDARVNAALGNLVRMAKRYQKERRYEDSGRVLREVLAEASAGRQTDFETSMDVVLRQANYLEKTNRRPSDLIDLYESSAALRTNSSRHRLVRADLRRRLALAYLDADRTEEAAAVLDPLLAELERDRGDESLNVAALLLDVVQLRTAQNDSKAVEESLLRAIAIHTKHHPISVPIVVTTNQLALFYIEQERSQEAIDQAKTALATARELKTVVGLSAAVLDTLASAEAAAGLDDDADQHYREAIDEMAGSGQAAQMSAGVVLENYASFLRSRGRSEEAQGIEARRSALLAGDAETDSEAEAEAGAEPSSN